MSINCLFSGWTGWYSKLFDRVENGKNERTSRTSGKWLHLRHVMLKQALRSLLLSPQRRIGEQGLANPSLGMTPTIKLYSPTLALSPFFLNLAPKQDTCHTKRRIGGALPANHSFGMKSTKVLKHVFPWHGSFVSNTQLSDAKHPFKVLEGSGFVMNYV